MEKLIDRSICLKRGCGSHCPMATLLDGCAREADDIYSDKALVERIHRWEEMTGEKIEIPH